MKKRKSKQNNIFIGLLLFILGISTTPFLLYKSYISITNYIQGPSLINPNECNKYLNRYITLHEDINLLKIRYFREGYSRYNEYPKVYIAPLKTNKEAPILISIPGAETIKKTQEIYKKLKNPTGILRDIKDINKYRTTSFTPFSKKDIIRITDLIHPTSKTNILNHKEALCILVLNSTPDFYRSLFLLLLAPLFMLFTLAGGKTIKNRFKN